MRISSSASPPSHYPAQDLSVKIEKRKRVAKAEETLHPQVSQFFLPDPRSIPPWNKSNNSHHMSSAGQAELPCFVALCRQPDHSPEVAVPHGPEVSTMDVKEEVGGREPCDSSGEYPSSVIGRSEVLIGSVYAWI